MREPVEDVKDLVLYLPLGFLGDPQIAQRCPASLVNAGAWPCRGMSPRQSRRDGPADDPRRAVNANSVDPTGEEPLYNIVPEKGYAAEFAFQYSAFVFDSYANVVRHDGAYMLRVSIPGVAPVAHLFGVHRVALWRQPRTISAVYGEELTRDLGAFLTNPSACSTEPLDASLEFNTWEHPDTMVTQSATAFAGIEGCGHLRFSTALSARPASTQADEPSGYTIGLEAPQAPIAFTGLATPPAKNVSVTLPAGTSLSPSAANGLGSCQETGGEGIDIEGAESEALAADGLPRPVAGHCPASSQVATVGPRAPDLAEELKGHLFLAAPKCGGQGQPGCTPADAQNGNLFGLYLELEAPGAGVVIKLAGKALVDPTTGR